jgi:peptide deformylase
VLDTTQGVANVEVGKLRIVLYPDPVLRKHCAPVTEFGPALQELTLRMLELMHRDRGVGLAAPQVGLPLRLFVCNPTGKPEDDRAYVNPELRDLVGLVEGEEGCLSLPEVTVPMRRAQSAQLTAWDALGNAVQVAGVDLEARVWQHEYDHLDGRMIIDNMPTSAELANRRLLKELREKYRAG